MNSVPYGNREAQLEQIVSAIKRGRLFSVNVDILPTQMGEVAHVWLPAATVGEMNLTSMNGERRLRLTERYMDPPGAALPDALIAARIANALEASFRRVGNETYANKFKTDDGRAKLMKTEWRGLQVVGRDQQKEKEKEKEKYAFLNNGRNNLIWQNAIYDVHTPFVRERNPVAPIDMNPSDIEKLELKAGDLVDVYNDVGSTQAMVYPTPTAKP